VMNETYPPGTLAPLVPGSPGARKPKTGLWIGLGIGLVVVCCAAAALVLFFERERLPAVAGLLATHTPRPTATPTATRTPLASPTPTQLPPTPTPKFFALTDSAFEANYKDTCETDVTITAVQGTSFTVKGKISMRNSQWVLWCYGAKHTWIGTLTYAGFTFTSDAADPLQFVIDQKRGYVYLGGKGSVTAPDGTVTKLP
jgi:hypothetical protein